MHADRSKHNGTELLNDFMCFAFVLAFDLMLLLAYDVMRCGTRCDDRLRSARMLEFQRLPKSALKKGKMKQSVCGAAATRRLE